MWYKEGFKYTYQTFQYENNWTSGRSARLFNIRGKGEVLSLDIKIPDNESRIMILIDGYYYILEASREALNIHFVDKFPTTDTYVYHKPSGIGVAVDIKNIVFSGAQSYPVYRPNNNSTLYIMDNECFLVGNFKFKKNFAVYMIGYGTSTVSDDKLVSYNLCINLFRNHSESNYII